MKRLIVVTGLILTLTTCGHTQTRISPINPGWGYSGQGLMNNLLSQPPMGNPMMEAWEQQQMQQRAYEQGVADAKRKQESSYTVEETLRLLQIIEDMKRMR